MAADRRWDQRRFHIEESSTQNNGQRTIFIEYMTPGTTVPIHYHDHFSETFDPLSGSITVFSSDQTHDSEEAWISSASSTTLKAGQKAMVKPGQYHKYVAGSDEELVLRVVVEPGYLDFERLLMILNGLADDGKLEGMGDCVALMALIMDLGNAHVIGPAKAVLDGVYETRGTELAQLKAQLLAKYDNEDSLRKLLAKK
ncbi:hypothetical protein N0V93_000611 [Gnomoniopsis smithogilvyi]|uniref:Cupin n=1 Tax=Gnomoniopsis smithogilvyi TaxID=1191159 RepID=A0A9W9D0E6_9PEZI|nr:hypothetical protein N0V93_000611 [Gnomoniopsis smithogilvyi]